MSSHNRWLNASLGVAVTLAVATAMVPDMVSAAGNKALEIMKKSVLARGEVTYSGVAAVTSYRDDEPVKMTQIILRQKGGRQRLKLQDAAGKVVWVFVSDGKTVWEHHMSHGRLYQRTLPGREQQLARDLYDLEVLGANFDVSLLGTEKVAGRPAYRIRISHPGPPTLIIRDVWIDQGNYTELRTDKFGEGNRLQHSVALERVNLQPDIPADTFRFQPPPNVTVRVIQPPKFTGTLSEVQRVVRFQPLPPPRLPAGFSLFAKSVAVREFEGVPVIWFQHTDGIRTFSVFQRKLQGTDPAGASGGRARTIRIGGYQFTIVGPLNDEEFGVIKAGYEQDAR